MSIRGAKQITVGGYSVEVIRKTIKNIHLSIHPPEGRVRLAVPLATGDAAVRLLVVRKLPWIKKQISSFENQERQTKRKFVSGESHYYRGSRYRLNVVYHDAPPKVAVRNKTRLDLFLRKGSNISRKKEALTEWYRNDLKERVLPLLNKWQSILGVEAADWGVRHMKTKWGSCNTQTRRVLFNLELAKKDDSCLEYVIAHELVHLIERNHNDRFIAHMDRVIPKWRSFRAELNRSLAAYEID